MSHRHSDGDSQRRLDPLHRDRTPSLVVDGDLPGDEERHAQAPWPDRGGLEPTAGGDASAAGRASYGSSAGIKQSIRRDIRASIRKARSDERDKKDARSSKQTRPSAVTWSDRAAALRQKILIEGILRQKPLPPSDDGRHIPLDICGIAPGTAPDALVDERSGGPYIDNAVHSSHYTVYDFVPKQLIYQFSKIGNFYFLVMGIIQMIPGSSTVGRWTTIVPLGIFVAFSMAKEGADDYRRSLQDKTENHAMAYVAEAGTRKFTAAAPPRKVAFWSPTMMLISIIRYQIQKRRVARLPPPPPTEDGWTPINWQNVQVGDVVRLRRDEGVPADMVLLRASGPNGVAYIDTMALDGETNLKSRQASPLFMERCKTRDGLRSIRAIVVSEDPNIDLYSYDGRASVEGETLPLRLNNVIYRGSTIRNTAEVVGLVINTGEECKIRMNSNKDVAVKKPAMHTIINRIVLLQVAVVLMLSMGLTIGYYLWQKRVEDNLFYIVHAGVYDGSVPFKNIFLGYLTMFNTLIPLSLYISLEIIKIGQLILLHEPEMYDPETDTPMVANTATVLENLGQVNYVFSDKTGTMTENVMRFRKLSVAGVACLHDMDIERDEDAKRRRISLAQPQWKGKESQSASSDAAPGEQRPTSLWSLSKWWTPQQQAENSDMKTEDLLDYIMRKPNSPFSQKAKHCLLCIALCHTCLPETAKDGKIQYQAASPDELALVEAAQDLGLVLIDRPSNSIKLQTTDRDGMLQTESYEVLDVIEFSSKRKRMSIIVRMPDDRICVICKGADNVVTSRLRLNQLAEQTAVDIGRRASVRKVSAQGEELRRMSTQPTAVESPRNSLTLQRRESNSKLDRSRFSMGQRSPDLDRLSQTEGFTSWLNRRGFDDPSHGSVDMLRSPRPNVGRMQSRDDADPRIDEAVAASDSAVFEKTFLQVNDFASDGLRTLFYAYRYLDETTYAEWKQLYREAENSLVDRQDRTEAAADRIEQKFELAGATGIEDRLQEGVPETIDKLRRANIKVWMLTGDKRETAINIGHSARVCKPHSELYILDETLGDLRESLTRMIDPISQGTVPHSVLIVDGQTLATIEADEDLAVLFYDLAIVVDSVICCRASPSQKSNLVNAIRRYVPGSMTLAVGDGANDVGMIQASHVGIGISGREGLQAARVSDYSIAQFRFLQRLLFVHGRWNYMRTSKYVLATFWKEMFFYLVQAHYQTFDGYTGTSLYESASLTIFNTCFTSLPVILMGIFDKDLQAETLLAIPELYAFGQKGRGFNFRQYFWWMIQGVSASVIVFYMMWAVYRLALFDSDTSLYAMGVICFTVTVLFINIKLLILETHSKTVIIFGGFIVSIGGWFFWNLALGGVDSAKDSVYLVHGAFVNNFGRQLLWWVTVLLELVTLVGADLALQALRKVYWPADEDIVQRLEKDVGAQRAMKDRAAAAERGETERFEMQDLDITGKQDGRTQPKKATRFGTGRHTRLSEDEEIAPYDTARAETSDTPFGAFRTKIKGGGDHDYTTTR